MAEIAWVDELADLLLVGKITGQHVHALAEIRCQGIEAVLPATGNRDRSATGMKRARGGFADSARSSRNQGSFT